MSSSYQTANNQYSKPKAKKSKNQIEGKVLRLRNPPTTVSGVPEILFNDFNVVMEITGPKTINIKLVPKQPEKTSFGSLPQTELNKLAAATGFISRFNKSSTKDDLTEKCRALLFQTNAQPNRVKDVKPFVTEINKIQENLKTTVTAIKYAGESEREIVAANEISFYAKRAISAVESYIDDRLTNVKPKKLDDHLIEHHFPLSLKQKFITGSVKPTSGNLGSFYFGKDPTKYCYLSCAEAKLYSETELKRLFGKHREDLDKLIKDENFLTMTGIGKLEEIPERTLSMIKRQVFPTLPVLSQRALLEEHERTRLVIRYRNPANAIYPAFDKFYNKMLAEHLAPPSELVKVKAWWAAICKTTLREPSISSKSYRTQTIESLEYAKVELDPNIATTRSVLTYKTRSLEDLMCVYHTREAAGVTIVNPNYEKYLAFEPIQLKKTVKDRKVFLGNAASITSKFSKSVLKALAKNRIPKEVRKDVDTYLRTFTSQEMQNVAAQVVLATCELSERDAAKRVLHLNDDELAKENEGSEEDPSVDDQDDPESEIDLAGMIIKASDPNLGNEEEESKEEGN